MDPTSFIKDIKKEYNIKSTKPKEIENYEPIRKEEFIKETKMIKKNEEEDYPEDFDDYKDDFEPLEEPTPELIKKALENKKDNKTNSNKKQKEEDSDSDEISKTNKTDNNNNIITNKPLFSGVNFKKPFQNVATLQRNEKIDERKINLEENILSLEKKEASESKKDFQRNRILQFQSMIELDLYEELLDIPPSSEFKIIN